MKIADASRIFAGHRSCGRPLRTVCLGLALLVALGGCTTMMPGGLGGAKAGDDGLYDGEPEAVFATEFPVESADDARVRAAKALNQRDLDLALYMYVQAVQLEPDDSESLYRIGAIHEQRGNNTLAARAYARVLEIDPEHARALQGFGLTQFEARDFPAAKSTLEHAVAVDPSLWRSHNILGVIADTDGDYETAADHYGKALAARPGSVSLLNNRGYSKYMAGDYAGAKADFLKALEANPEFERAWHNLGLVYAREGAYEKALEAMSKVMAAHVAANDVGYIAMLDGDYDWAEHLFAEAQRLSPRYYKMADDNAAELRRRRGGESVLAVER
jgi:Flp pilus assembly protein TadD